MTKPITAEEIAKLRRLLSESTQGRWDAWRGHGGSSVRSGLDMVVDHDHVTGADALLIAAARNALPGLLDEVERLRGELAARDERLAEVEADAIRKSSAGHVERMEIEALRSELARAQGINADRLREIRGLQKRVNAADEECRRGVARIKLLEAREQRVVRVLEGRE